MVARQNSMLSFGLVGDVRVHELGAKKSAAGSGSGGESEKKDAGTDGVSAIVLGDTSASGRVLSTPTAPPAPPEQKKSAFKRAAGAGANGSAGGIGNKVTATAAAEAEAEAERKRQRRAKLNEARLRRKSTVTFKFEGESSFLFGGTTGRPGSGSSSGSSR